MSSQRGPDVAVVVVNHNSAPEVFDCLDSLAACPDAGRVIVVDNASTDGSCDEIVGRHPRVEMIRSPRNLGFAAGANLGASAVQEELIFFVNPDATVSPDTIGPLRDLLASEPRAAAVGPLVLNPDGSVQPSKRAFPSLWQAAMHGLVGPVWADNPGTRAYILADQPLDRARPVDWVSASAVLVRRSAFAAVGGFDEDFFFFVEDVDLCRRLTDSGWAVWFEPRARVVHAWGRTWTRKPLRHLWLHHRNLFRYVRKHRRGAWVLAYPAIVAGLALRFVLMALRWLISRESVPAHRGSSSGGAG